MRATTTADVRTIARLHRSQLGHGLYPLLGERFLRAYHQVLLRSPYAANFAVGPVGSPHGFIVTLVDPPGHRQWLRGRSSLMLALHGLVGLLTHPRALVLFLRTRVGRYARALFGRSTVEPRTDAPAVLLHVVVAPDGRGSGVGAALVGAVVTAAVDADRDVVRLVTDAGSPAERFYRRLGWNRVGERTGRDGSRVAEYEHATGATGS